jgi:VanZ family protein
LPRRHRHLAAAALPVSVFFVSWASLQPSLAPPSEGGADKGLHVLCFAVFGAMAALAFNRRLLPVAAAGLLAVGAGIEIAQHFVPGREGSVGDWLADAIGLVIGIAALELVRRRLGPGSRSVAPEP